MRVDEINLIGNFVLNGLTGGISQGIGYSGSTLQWITVTGSGGGGGSVGPQGSTGPSALVSQYPVDAYQIVFSDGNPALPPLGLTSSPKFLFTHEQASNQNNLYLANTGSVCISNSTYSSIMASDTATISSSDFSSIISTFNGCINQSRNSVIMGGRTQYIQKSKDSVLVGGESNIIICSGNSILLTGCRNFLCGASNSIIISGASNSVSGPIDPSNCGRNNTIIGGCSNVIDNQGTSNSSIIGGYRNLLDTGAPQSDNATIIGSKNSYLVDQSDNGSLIGVSNTGVFGLQNGSIIGMTGISFLGSGDYTKKVYMQKLIVRDYTQFDGHNPATVSNGTLWFDGSKMRFRTFNTNFCIDCF
jgi:hypothetical protein